MYLFGSAANGLCMTRVADLDITLHLDGFRELEKDAKGALVTQLAETLEMEGMEVRRNALVY